MNKFDQLQLQVRGLVARVTALEAAQATRRARRKRPRPSDVVVTEREALWARYLRLEMLYGHGRMRLTYLAFAIAHHLNPDEFCRFFSATDKRGIPESSAPDRSFRRALTDAIAELEARAENNSSNTRLVSHGKMPVSQDSGARWQ